MRTMLQFSNMMRQQGLGPETFLGAGGGGFPAPGNPNASPNTTPTTSPPSTVPGAPASVGASQSLFDGGDPAALLRMWGAGGVGAGGLGAGGLGTPGAGFPPLFGSPSPPADTRSPEERFQVQLQVRFALLAAQNSDPLNLWPVSNCRIWASPMQRRTCVRCSQRVGMYILQ